MKERIEAAPLEQIPGETGSPEAQYELNIRLTLRSGLVSALRRRIHVFQTTDRRQGGYTEPRERTRKHYLPLLKFSWRLLHKLYGFPMLRLFSCELYKKGNEKTSIALFISLSSFVFQLIGGLF